VTRTHRRRHSFVAAALLAALVALLTATPALADTATLNNPSSSNAHAIDEIYRAILGVTVTIFVLVGGWLVYSAIRFRERPGESFPEPPQMHGSTRLEIGWAIVPLLILVGLSAFTFAKLPSVKDVPKGALEIKVVAQQYSFTYTYPGGKHPAATDTNTLVVPVDKPVHLSLQSKDVIHDWWVEDLGQKTDVIPGRTTHTWFRADKIGSYVGQCAEFCGPGHAGMLIIVKVVSQADFDSYMTDKAQ
jgi:cytochrome c oxidase subunit II